MQIIVERSHDKYSSAIFAKPNLQILSSDRMEVSDIEILTIELKNCTVTSIYKRLAKSFVFQDPKNFDNQKTKIIVVTLIAIALHGAIKKIMMMVTEWKHGQKLRS